MLKLSPPLRKNEALFIWRRRKGWPQYRAAEDLHVCEELYREWEKGWTEFVKWEIELELPLDPEEVCLLLRRRFCLSQAEVAKKIGVSRTWVSQVENYSPLFSVAPLVEFWTGELDGSKN